VRPGFWNGDAEKQQQQWSVVFSCTEEERSDTMADPEFKIRVGLEKKIKAQSRMSNKTSITIHIYSNYKFIIT